MLNGQDQPLAAISPLDGRYQDKVKELGEYFSEGAVVKQRVMVEVKGSAEHVIKDLAAGLRSAMSYTGASTIKEFQEKAEFVLVSKATIRENQAHILWE